MERGPLPEEKGQQIIDAINSFGSVEPIAEFIANAHPTLQQTFMRLCLKFIKLESEKTYSDARNEATVEICKKIMEKLPYEDQYVPFI